MAHYLLFFPNVQGANPDHIKNAGLESLGVDAEFYPIDRGPGGKPGMFATWNFGNTEIDPWIGFDDSKQKWVQSVNKKYWLGWEVNRPPSPRSLKRNQIYDGYDVTLCDHNNWLIPKVTALPHRLKVDGEGNTVRAVKDEYREFYERGMEISRQIFVALDMVDEANMVKRVGELGEYSDNIQPVSIHDGAKFACQALGLNYRLNHEIAMHLELLDDRNLQAIITSASNLPEILETNRDQKKTEEKLTIPVT